jgi:hypothetical protein
LARKGEAQPSAHHTVPHAIWSSSLLKHPGPDAFANLERTPAADPEIARERPSRPHKHPVLDALAKPERSQPVEPEGTQEVPVGDASSCEIAQFSDPGAKTLASTARDKRHRVSLAVSTQEHERLGIVATKKGLTRHQLLRNALDFYFEKLSQEYRASCACIATGSVCANGCADQQPLVG